MNREEISKLFDIFFDHSELAVRKSARTDVSVAPHVPVVYKQFHTADLVLQRSQFLCTVYVMASISARAKADRQDLRNSS